MSPSGLHVVLVEPDIPGNTGNVARTCVATQSPLHLVGRLGFSLGDKYLKRAGLDYWPRLALKVHENWENFLGQAEPESRFYFFEKDGKRSFWEIDFKPGSYLIFGSETSGFPREVVQKYGSEFVRIPMRSPPRSTAGPEVVTRFVDISFARMPASVVLPRPGGP